MAFWTYDPPLTAGEQISLTVLYAVLFALYAIGSALYLIRRKSDVIAARNPYTVVFLAVALCGYSASSQLVRLYSAEYWCDNNYQFRPLVALDQLFVLSAFAGAVWRVLQFVCKFEAQRLRLIIKLREEGFVDGVEYSLPAVGGGYQQHNQPAGGAGDTPPVAVRRFRPLQLNVFQRHLEWFQSWKCRLVLVLAAITVPIIRLIVPPPLDDNCNYLNTDYALIGIGLIMVVALVSLAWKVRTIEDGFFFIKWECKMEGMLVFIRVVILAFLTRLSKGLNNAPVSVLISIITQFLILYVAFGWPLWRSFYPDRGISKRSTEIVVPPELCTLSGVLASKPGRASFEAHLMLEFSLESLLFVDEVEELRSFMLVDVNGVPVDSELSLNDAKHRAEQIYEKFINPHGAPFEVNLSAPVARRLNRAFGVTRTFNPFKPATAAATAAAAAAAAANPFGGGGSSNNKDAERSGRGPYSQLVMAPNSAPLPPPAASTGIVERIPSIRRAAEPSGAAAPADGVAIPIEGAALERSKSRNSAAPIASRQHNAHAPLTTQLSSIAGRGLADLAQSAVPLVHQLRVSPHHTNANSVRNSIVSSVGSTANVSRQHRHSTMPLPASSGVASLGLPAGAVDNEPHPFGTSLPRTGAAATSSPLSGYRPRPIASPGSKYALLTPLTPQHGRTAAASGSADLKLPAVARVAAASSELTAPDPNAPLTDRPTPLVHLSDTPPKSGSTAPAAAGPGAHVPPSPSSSNTSAAGTPFADKMTPKRPQLQPLPQMTVKAHVARLAAVAPPPATAATINPDGSVGQSTTPPAPLPLPLPPAFRPSASQLALHPPSPIAGGFTAGAAASAAPPSASVPPSASAPPTPAAAATADTNPGIGLARASVVVSTGVNPSHSRSAVPLADRTAVWYLGLFDEAQKEIYLLLENDSFTRYVNTPAFERFVKSTLLLSKLQADELKTHTPTNRDVTAGGASAAGTPAQTGFTVGGAAGGDRTAVPAPALSPLSGGGGHRHSIGLARLSANAPLPFVPPTASAAATAAAVAAGAGSPLAGAAMSSAVATYGLSGSTTNATPKLGSAVAPGTASADTKSSAPGMSAGGVVDTRKSSTAGSAPAIPLIVGGTPKLVGSNGNAIATASGPGGPPQLILESQTLLSRDGSGRSQTHSSVPANAHAHALNGGLVSTTGSSATLTALLGSAAGTNLTVDSAAGRMSNAISPIASPVRSLTAGSTAAVLHSAAPPSGVAGGAAGAMIPLRTIPGGGGGEGLSPSLSPRTNN